MEGEDRASYGSTGVDVVVGWDDGDGWWFGRKSMIEGRRVGASRQQFS